MFNILTLSITTLRILLLSIKTLNAECCYAKILNILTLSITTSRIMPLGIKT